MSEDRKQVDIGFGFGQVASARMTDAELGELREAVEKGEGWQDIETEDGRLTLNVATVGFIRVSSKAGRVGFGD